MFNFDCFAYDIPGLSISYSVDSNQPVSYAFGYSDVQNQRAMTTADLFQFGQVTELVTVMLLLRLLYDHSEVMDMSLEEFSRNYQADSGRLRIMVNQYSVLKPITVFELMSHSSGLPSYDKTEVFLKRMRKNPKKLWQIEVYLDLVTDSATRYNLGYSVQERGVYSRSATNYVLCGLLVEAITGQPVEQEISSLLSVYGFEDLNFSKLGLGVNDDAPQIARGYLPISYPGAGVYSCCPMVCYNNNQELKAFDVTGAYHAHGLSGMGAYGTLSGLVSWFDFLNTKQVISGQSYLDVMLARTLPLSIPGSNWVSLQAGLGVMVGVDSNLGDVIWQYGMVPGYEVLCMHFAAKKLTLALGVNSNRERLDFSNTGLVCDVLSALSPVVALG